MSAFHSTDEPEDIKDKVAADYKPEASEPNIEPDTQEKKLNSKKKMQQWSFPKMRL